MIDKLKPHEAGGFEAPDGCHWDSVADYLFIGVLPSCGCGDPASIGRYVLDCLKKYCAHDVNGERVYPNGPAYEDLPAMFFLSWADNQRYIEHGSTIRCSWTTPLGEELIRDLETVLAAPQSPNQEDPR